MKNLGRTVLAALITVAAALAQLTSGTISGTILDPSGAVVPEVKIVLKEISTGVSREGATNGAGVYRFAGLEPGVYTIEYAKAGFETVRVDHVELRTSQEALLNQSMPVAIGSVSVTVESSSAGAELSKTTPTVDRRIGRVTLDSLPLTGGREVGNLALLAPGINYSGGDTVGNATYSASGQRQSANGLLLDGIENKDSQYQIVQHQNIPEAVAEVHVMTNSFSAEFGRFLGAQISLVTRGGTNQFHGQGWDYYGGNWLSAATLANKRAGLNTVRFSDHQAGGSLGGPVRKQHTFFFLLAQTSPHAEGASANGLPSVTIPTPAGWAALQRAPLGPGQTAEGRQAALSALSFIPDIHTQIRRYDSIDTRSVNEVLVEFGSTRIPQSRPSASWRVQGRLDHHLSSKDTLSYRFSRQEMHAPVATAAFYSNNAFGRFFASKQDDTTQLHALTYTRLLGPSLVNELRLSANRQLNEAKATQDALPRTVVNGGYFNLGPNINSPFVRPTGSYNLQDTLTWTRGRHSAKAGAQILTVRDTLTGAKQSSWTFPNFQDFMNNRATTLSLRLKTSSEPFHSVHQSYFVQDDYKVRPDFILNLGLRYQVSNIPSGLFGAATPEIAAVGVPLRPQPDRNDWGPRAGFAYSPRAQSGWPSRLLGDGATVIRGGFGIGYGVVYQGEAAVNLLGLLSNYPWNLQRSFNMQEIANLYPTPPSAAVATAFNPLTASFANYPTEAKNPAMHFYAFSVQRQFHRDYILELGYLGNRSYHLYQRVEANLPVLTPEQAQLVVATKNTVLIPSIDQRRWNPAWRARTRLASVGTSNYNAGYLKFDRRLAKGLILGANYTWSASSGDSAGPAAQNQLDRRPEYARSENDRPHRLAVHYTWQTPGKRLWGGWRISGFSQWQSGAPFTITTGVDSNGDGETTDRPNYNSAGAIRLDPVTGDWRSFSTELNGGGVFVTPLTTGGTPLLYSMPFGGNLGRNTFRGPGFALWNLSLMKPFAISERLGIELRADSTNLLNHRNFGPPIAAMGDANFGRNDSNPPSRVLLLSAKIRF